ncbi:hypothetical protein AGOR_G00215860 [Albula goreensis]|uniref:Uncharacterized protein n=1 Tax=Albula goreensis TaxID=1534307 RepID=A0A8T3CR37_9TELE|nr:hypothetical protein AGOR_G00215860 [Albula goreensis]
MEGIICYGSTVYPPSPPQIPPSLLTGASWYCWYSDTRSFESRLASVNLLEDLALEHHGDVSEQGLLNDSTVPREEAGRHLEALGDGTGRCLSLCLFTSIFSTSHVKRSSQKTMAKIAHMLAEFNEIFQTACLPEECLFISHILFPLGLANKLIWQALKHGAVEFNSLPLNIS